MNTAITILRIPKAPHKTRDGCEAELNAETPQPIKGRQVFVNRRDHGDVKTEALMFEASLASIHHSGTGLIAGLNRLVVI